MPLFGLRNLVSLLVRGMFGWLSPWSLDTVGFRRRWCFCRISLASFWINLRHRRKNTDQAPLSSTSTASLAWDWNRVTNLIFWLSSFEFQTRVSPFSQHSSCYQRKLLGVSFEFRFQSSAHPTLACNTSNCDGKVFQWTGWNARTPNCKVHQNNWRTTFQSFHSWNLSILSSCWAQRWADPVLVTAHSAEVLVHTQHVQWTVCLTLLVCWVLRWFCVGLQVGKSCGFLATLRMRF